MTAFSMICHPFLTLGFTRGLGILLMAATISSGQQPAPTPKPPTLSGPDQKPAADVVRITTNLVQVDAVVTQGKDEPVTDLQPQELEIFEDNRPQKITHFSYVKNDFPNPTASQPLTKGTPLTMPPASLRPQDVRRAIAVVVDDLGLSFQSISQVRSALKRFVDSQVQDGDLVAIIRTSGGISALQQFTTDKRQLYAAIEQIKWYAAGRSGASPMAAIKPPTPGRFGAEIDAKNEELDQFRDDVLSVGTLGAISYVITGLKELPGRKSLVLISDGFRVMAEEKITRTMEVATTSRSDRTLQRLHQLVDEANRAAVVIDTINAASLQIGPVITAEDSLIRADSPTGARSADELASLMTERSFANANKQTGLDYLADQTGGMAIRSTNDLGRGIRRIMNDPGYYLIGYRPNESTFDAKTGQRTFHHLTIKILRPGKFEVRMRNGFYGTTGTETASAPAGSVREQILRALISPFGSNGVPIKLTSLFANEANGGSVMRSLLHVDGSALTFTDEADDWHQALFDVVGVTFGADGHILDQVSRVDRLRVRGEAYQRVLKTGFVYVIIVPVKKPGAYQLRIALRDQASERVGAASQFVEVPDLKKHSLELSGILVNGAANQAANVTGTDRPEPGDAANIDPANSAAVRKFRAGQNVRYSFVIYNARLDRVTGQPNLQVQMRILRGSEAVFTGKTQSFVLSNPPDITRLSAASAIQIGADMPPGDYALQVIVTDLAERDKPIQVSRWIDFEIVR
jgi:VWFA-related protein